MKIYIVFHEYDTNNGFGDAVPQEDVVAMFEDKQDAEQFVKDFEKPHVYDYPYEDFSCGILSVCEFDIIAKGQYNFSSVNAKEFWWLER